MKSAKKTILSILAAAAFIIAMGILSSFTMMDVAYMNPANWGEFGRLIAGVFSAGISLIVWLHHK